MTSERLGRVRDVLATQAAHDRRSLDPTPAQVAAALAADTRLLGDTTARAVVDELHRDLVGCGRLEPLTTMPGVTDVLVHGPREVFVDRGHGLEPVGVAFPDDQAVRRLAQRLAASAGRRLDDASPYVDARLPDGIRLHAVLAPLSTRGTSISLRIPRREPLELACLVAEPIAGLLARVVEARLACLITGGAGSGKTTLLGAMLSRVAPTERIVIVEDSRELAPAHPHVVQLEARPPNIEGSGGICVRTLVRQALRMRPDRLVIGEVRGNEIVDLLAALNTGHDGGYGTLHANSVADVPARVEALALAAGLDRPAVHSQLTSAFDLVIHVVRRYDGSRGVSEVALLRCTSRGRAEVRPALRCRAGSTTLDDAGVSLLRRLLSRDGGTCPV